MIEEVSEELGQYESGLRQISSLLETSARVASKLFTVMLLCSVAGLAVGIMAGVHLGDAEHWGSWGWMIAIALGVIPGAIAGLMSYLFYQALGFFSALIETQEILSGLLERWGNRDLGLESKGLFKKIGIYFMFFTDLSSLIAPLRNAGKKFGIPVVAMLIPLTWILSAAAFLSSLGGVLALGGMMAWVAL